MIAVRLGPQRPARDRGIGSVEGRLQRLAGRVQAQRPAPLVPEFPEGAAARACGAEVALAEVRVEQFEDFEFCGSDAVIVDQRRLAQLPEARLEPGRTHTALRKPARR